MSEPPGPLTVPSDPWSDGPSDSASAGLTPRPLLTPPSSVDQATTANLPATPMLPPPPPQTQLPATAVVARIGELAVTSTAVHTPAGEIPLKHSSWHVSDHWLTEQKTPAWAIVLAVVGFCVLTVFSLLFLLVKETVYRGTVQVTVTNGQRQYVARIPVATQAEVQQVHQQVNYVRSLAAL